MVSYARKLHNLVLNILQAKNQTRKGKRLFLDFTFTANPSVVESLYNDPAVTRSAISRRMLEQAGAANSVVSHNDKTHSIIIPHFKEFMTADVYQNCYKEAIFLITKEIQQNKDKSTIDIYNIILTSLKFSFLEHWLGIDTKEYHRDILMGQESESLNESEVFLQKSMLLNLFPIPLWVRNLFSSKHRWLDRLFNEHTEFIYNSCAAKPGSWFERLKRLEYEKIITHKMVLGEIRSIFISASTLATSITAGIYCLSTTSKTTKNAFIDRLIDDKVYARNVFKETIRLYPPFRILLYEKKSKCPFHFNSYTFLSLFNIHRNPYVWRNPLTFNPDRFNDTKAIFKGSFIPFGGGDRKCPGMGMSMLIGSQMLQHLFETYVINVVTINPFFTSMSVYESGQLHSTLRYMDVQVNLNEGYCNPT